MRSRIESSVTVSRRLRARIVDDQLAAGSGRGCSATPCGCGSLPCSSHSNTLSPCNSRVPPLIASISTPSTSSLIRYFPCAEILPSSMQVVERDHRHFLAAAVGAAGDAERLVLGAGQPRGAARRADRALHHLEAVAVDLGVVGELGEILRRRLDRDRLVRTVGRARDQHRPVAEIGAAIDQRVVDVDANPGTATPVRPHRSKSG